VSVSVLVRALWVVACYFANRLAGRHAAELEEAASETLVLSDFEVVGGVPAISLPGAFDAVAQADELSTIEMQREFLDEVFHEERPTKAFLLRDACILGNQIWTRRHRLQFSHLSPQRWRWPVAMERALLGTVDLPFFGHWLTEDCPRALIGEELDVPVIVAPATESLHKTQYRKLLSLKTVEARNALVAELIVVRDHNSQNKLKRRHLQEMRARLARGRAKGLYERLYLSRGQAWSSRSPLNEPQLQAALQASGYVVVDPTELTIERLLELAWGAEVVIGVEGSQLTHAIFFMRDGGCLCSLQPPTRFTAILKHWCDSMGVRFGFVVGEAVQDGWTVDPKRVLETVDLLGRTGRPAGTYDG
jgi:hypothetical protein